MSFLNWLSGLFTAPAKVQELNQQLVDNKILLEEARDNFAGCLGEKVIILHDASLAMEGRKALEDQINQLNIVLADKDSEIQALKDSQSDANSSLKSLLSELATLRKSYQQLTELYGIAQDKLVDIETLTDQIYKEVTVGSSG